MKVTYFQLWARGPSIALALEHAGVDYEAVFPDNWKELKPTTPWGALPMFEAPLAGKVLTLGHELAILAYIERKCPAVAGADEREWAVSQQFVHQAEDVYKALVAKQPTLYEKDKVSKEALAEWWAGDDRTLHNRKQGLQVHLALLEAARRRRPNLYGRSGSHTARFPRRRPPQRRAKRGI
jgi:glutathione S-transferase